MDYNYAFFRRCAVYLYIYIKTFPLSSEKRTKAPPVPRKTLLNAPLNKALKPSCVMIFFAQSHVFLYKISLRPDCIIIRRRTVSHGYDVIPLHTVTT
ncbi:hypothetical protein T02_12945 [Trichinella nativa]|uniref:Uncharacterized protein n=1 Tax=Trichinella nativa TaxID=6335 RepID=A0A0V1L5B4_9BILA|nr:hypothetical protein T02_12945 [Trichinella nativa]